MTCETEKSRFLTSIQLQPAAAQKQLKSESCSVKQYNLTRMPRAKITDEDKRRLLRSFENGEDYQQLAAQLDINKQTAKSIVYRAMKRDGLVSMPRGGKRYQKVDDDMKELIITLVEENRSITLHSSKN